MSERANFVTSVLMAATGVAFYVASTVYIFSKMANDYSLGLIAL